MTSHKALLFLATVIMLTVAAGILAAATVHAPRSVTIGQEAPGTGLPAADDQPRRPTPARV